MRVFFFLACLQHLAIDVQRADQGLVVHGNSPNGSTDFFNTLSNPTLVAKDVIYITQTLLGDAFVTYRLFMVWNRSWPVIVLPILLLLGAAGAFPLFSLYFLRAGRSAGGG